MNDDFNTATLLLSHPKIIIIHQAHAGVTSLHIASLSDRPPKHSPSFHSTSAIPELTPREYKYKFLENHLIRRSNQYT